MAGPEIFSPTEGGESYDPAAFEQFKERIKKNAAFIAAAKKSEQKQKEKEDKLAKILLRFIQQNQKSAILMLAAKLLEENIPPSFILAIIILGNEEVMMELKKEANLEPAQIPQNLVPGEFSLIAEFSHNALPLKLKAEIDSWGKGIFEAGSAVPFRILETAIDKQGNIKSIVIDCCANVLQDFIEGNGIQPEPYDTYFSFCEFFAKGVFAALKKQIENQKELE